MHTKQTKNVDKLLKTNGHTWETSSRAPISDNYGTDFRRWMKWEGCEWTPTGCRRFSVKYSVYQSPTSDTHEYKNDFSEGVWSRKTIVYGGQLANWLS